MERTAEAITKTAFSLHCCIVAAVATMLTTALSRRSCMHLGAAKWMDFASIVSPGLLAPASVDALALPWLPRRA
jgi:hypothetical protein